MAPRLAAQVATRTREDATQRAEAPPPSCLLVEAAGQRLALPAGTVTEVLRPRRMTRVPHAPDALLGVTSLRGAVLPVLSLARLRGDDAPSPTDSARIVVLAQNPTFGVLVDAVAGFGDGEALPRLDVAALVAQGLGPAVPRRAAPASTEATASAPVRRDAGRAILGFTVAGRLFGLPLDGVAAVAPMPDAVTATPGSDAALLGVVARADGGLMPLVSGRALLGFPAADTVGPGRVVVTRVGEAEVGLVVDALDAILRVAENAIAPVPALLTRRGGEARVEGICRLDGGRRLLSLLAPDRLFDEGTMRLLRAAAPSVRGGAAGGGLTAPPERFLVFGLGGEDYALPLAAVDEVVRLPATLAAVPRAPAFLAGVMDRRGAPVPIIDAGLRFGAPCAPGPARGRVIVMAVAGVRAGLAVDGVSDVLSAAAGDLRAAPALVGGRAGTFDRVLADARHDRPILVVDPSALLAQAERDILGPSAGQRRATASAAP